METIKRVVNLSNLVSRVPSTINYLDKYWVIDGVNGKRFSTLTEAESFADTHNLSNRQINTIYDYHSINDDIANGNYGKIISTIEIPDEFVDKITDITDVNVNIPNENGGYYQIDNLSVKYIKSQVDFGLEKIFYYYKGDIYSCERNDISGSPITLDNIILMSKKHKYLSFSTLNKWYVFFKKYKKLLNSGKFLKGYSSARDYYLSEVGSVVPDEITKMDELFESRGGDDFLNFIELNYIPCFNIPKEYHGSWGTTYLYYSEVVKWIGWLRVNGEKYKTLEGQCAISENCCECEKYFRLGGEHMLELLEDWISSVNIEKSGSINSSNITLTIPITSKYITNGMMSPSSEEWSDNEKYSQGSVVYEPFIINNNGDKEYFYKVYISNVPDNIGENNEYGQRVFQKEKWLDYTEEYIQKNKDKFATKNYCYSINHENEIIFNPTDEKMEIEYEPVVYEHGFILIDGEVYEVINGKYAVYSNANNSLLPEIKIPVQEENGVYYCYVDGIRYDAIERNGSYYFAFGGNEYCMVNSDYNNHAEGNYDYILFKGGLYLKDTDEDSFIIERNGYSYHYDIFDGYVIIDDIFYCIKNGKLLRISGNTTPEYPQKDIFQNYEYSNEEWVNNDIYPNVIYNENGLNCVKILYPYDIINTDEITGYTNSKLLSLKTKEEFIDNLGNTMPGYYDRNVNEALFYPENDAILNLYYSVGNTNNLVKNETIVGDDNTVYYNGDIIDEIKIYYKYDNGDIIKDAIVTLKNGENGYILNGDVIEGTVVENTLGGIKLCEDTIKEIYSGDTYEPEKKLYCDITYYLDATLEYNKIENKIRLSENKNKGIRYTDTYQMNLEVYPYYMSSIQKYFIKYYNMEQIGMSKISMKIKVLYFDFNEVTEKDYSFEERNGYSDDNRVIATPVYKNEMLNSIIMPQKVNSDIYIDRGNARAFDRHLMLHGIRTLDALEDYQNGLIFNITKF